MAAQKAHFSPKLFKFLKELKQNNDRDWFNDNKGRYESDVKEPLLGFIEAFAPKLAKISPHFIASKKSMFRIYRDVRFSNDKSPYKTMASAHFRHERGKDVHAPGFYLHLEPGGMIFSGTGLWKADTKTLTKVRAAIDGQSDQWKKIKRAKAFKTHCRMEGDSLKRAPKGYDPDHPLIEDLRRKDFCVVTDFTQKDACSADFVDKFAKACKAAAPFTRFITESIGLAF